MLLFHGSDIVDSRCYVLSSSIQSHPRRVRIDSSLLHYLLLKCQVNTERTNFPLIKCIMESNAVKLNTFDRSSSIVTHSIVMQHSAMQSAVIAAHSARTSLRPYNLRILRSKAYYRPHHVVGNYPGVLPRFSEMQNDLNCHRAVQCLASGKDWLLALLPKWSN